MKNKIIKIKRFNEKGNIEFEKFTKQCKKEFNKGIKKKFLPPISLLNDLSLIESVEGAGEIDTSKIFVNAFDYAKYIDEKLLNIDFKKYRWDRGLFNWISAALFHNFFPGVRGGKDEKRVFLLENKGKWRRHFARTFWEIYHVYKDNSLCLLYKETNNFSDELETISKSPIMFSSKGVLETYSVLFFKKLNDLKGEQKYKRGEKADFRSFIDELLQIELNKNVFQMTKNTILENLDPAFKNRLNN